MDRNERTPQGMTRTWDQAESIKGEGGSCGTWRRGRHAVQVTDTINRGWRVVGVGDVQVDGALFQERRWGAGERERGYKEK